MSVLKALLVVLVSLLCFSALCAAQGGANLADFYEIEEEVLPEASTDVITASVFPRFADKKFISGEPVEILIGFRNKGPQEFNITYVEASFNYPLDYSYYIQNFTRVEYGVTGTSNQEVTVSYLFRPDPLLEPRDYGLVVSVYYQDPSRKNYTNVVFNSTVEIIEGGSGIDAQSFFAILAVIALLGLVVFFLFRGLGSWSKKQSKGKAGSRRTEAGGSRSKQDEDDWLAGTSADPKLQKRKKSGGVKSSR